MSPLTYYLCSKPAIGLALFIVNACSFPPLISDLPLSLISEGAIAEKDFVVEVEKDYFFEIKFSFSSAAAVRNDNVIGSGSNYGKHCDGEETVDDIMPSLQDGAGRPIPIQVTVLRAEDRTVVEDRVFWTMCRFASGGDKNHWDVWRNIGHVHLERGHYHAFIKNVRRQTGLDGVATSVLLVSGHGK